MAKLRLAIEGEPQRIEVDSFVQASERFVKLLKEIDQVITAKYRGTLGWYVSDLSADSNGLCLDVLSRLKPPTKARATEPLTDLSQRIAGSLMTGFDNIQNFGVSPPYLSTYGLSNLNGMLSVLGRNGATAFKTTDLEKGNTVELNQRAVETVRALLPTAFKTIGSVEGHLEAISIHGNKRFVVYDALTKKAIRCDFDGDEMLERVKSNLGKRVLAEGTVSWNPKSEPKRVVVEALRVLGEGMLPSTRELSGAYPNITDGMTTAEYIRSIRGD